MAYMFISTMARQLCGQEEHIPALSRHSIPSIPARVAAAYNDLILHQHPHKPFSPDAPKAFLLFFFLRDIHQSVLDLTGIVLFVVEEEGGTIDRQLTMAARKSQTGVPRAPVVAVMVVVMTMLASRAASQNNGCSSVMMTLSPCLDYISGKSPIPEFTCCTTLAGVVQSDPRCLCMVLDGSAASFGISINHTRALELPGVCKVQAPPISQCTAVPTPPPAPDTPTLADEPAETNEDEPSPPPAGSNKTSSATNSKKAASLMASVLIPTCALFYVF
ncbi:non-specific lipid transfer protein GPI-anchored 15-like isoform X2 [Oryza glaberrima]|uniref:non-specific lipid transfer protein GPI-anchored 15-like isoform X2 n=1 Tax=Oryza glaberrima TaxID=4538 RepID=UPI00224C5AE3|nr:non-specific lipid transfer protein GPI-anchored 15-like isoform X2 [Oryza glaberrima]